MKKKAIDNTSNMPLKNFIFGSAFIFFLTFIIYIPTITGGFIWDDYTLIIENPLIKAGDGLYRFWLTTEAPDYFPLTSTTFWIEWRLWGMNPAGYHLLNIFLHVMSAILIWRVLKMLNIPGAWLAGLIFAVHPVNSESVAWIAERKNTLSMFFYVLSIFIYLKSERKNSRYLYLLSLVAFLLALLSKTAVVMMPFVLLGCAWWQRQKITPSDIFRTIPFFALSAMLSLVTIWFQYNRAIAGDIVRTDSFFSRFAVAGRAIWFYIYKAVFPHELMFVYPRWETDAPALTSYIPGLILISMLMLFWRYRTAWGRSFLFSLGYVTVTLFPVLGFFNIYFMRYSLVSDHWQYVAVIGVIALVCGIGTYLYESRNKIDRQMFVAVSVLIVTLFAYKTWTQAHIYKDQETLWADSVAKNPDAALARIHLGAIRKEQGRLEEAFAQFSQVLKRNPADAEANYNMGVVLELQGKLDEAAGYYSKVLKIKPSDADAHNNLGDILKRQGKFEDALTHYSEALKIKPDDAKLYNNAGIVLGLLGKTEEAVGHFSRAIKIKSDDAETHFNLGFTHERQGQIDAAAAAYSDAVRLNPDFEKAHYHLGTALTRKGNMDQAVQQFLEVLRINPKNEKAHYNLGAALEQQGKTDEAVRHLSEAVRLNPDYLKAHESLGRMLKQPGKSEP
jgi:tetratricopeptide (TPR) repeat protein